MSGESFEASKLDWGQCGDGECARFASLYCRSIGLRMQQIIPRLSGMEGNSGRYEQLGNCVIKVTWTLGDGSELAMVANPFNGINVWRPGHFWLEGFATGLTLEGRSAGFILSAPAPS